MRTNFSFFFFVIRFLRVVLPCDHPNLRTQVSQRPIIKKEKGEKFSEELEYTLAKLFNEYKNKIQIKT
jgi:hypothetical protein